MAYLAPLYAFLNVFANAVPGNVIGDTSNLAAFRNLPVFSSPHAIFLIAAPVFFNVCFIHPSFFSGLGSACFSGSVVAPGSSLYVLGIVVSCVFPGTIFSGWPSAGSAWLAAGAWLAACTCFDLSSFVLSFSSFAFVSLSFSAAASSFFRRFSFSFSSFNNLFSSSFRFFSSCFFFSFCSLSAFSFAFPSSVFPPPPIIFF